MNNNFTNLNKKRGFINFSSELMRDVISKPDVLAIIYQNFFPVIMEHDHSNDFYKCLRMYGFSPHFEEIENGAAIPQYSLSLITDENGTRFDKMELVK